MSENGHSLDDRKRLIHRGHSAVQQELEQGCCSRPAEEIEGGHLPGTLFITHGMAF